jgi:hypothetical protein
VTHSVSDPSTVPTPIFEQLCQQWPALMAQREAQKRTDPANPPQATPSADAAPGARHASPEDGTDSEPS